MQQTEVTERANANPPPVKDSGSTVDGATSVLEQSSSIGSGMQVGIDAFGAWAIGVGSTIGSYAFLTRIGKFQIC